MLVFWLLLAALLVQVSCDSGIATQNVGSIEDLPLNEKGNLRNHWILYPPNCTEQVHSAWKVVAGEYREHGIVEYGNEMFKQFFENSRSRQAIGMIGCPATCLTKGTPKNLLQTPADYLVYSGKRDSIKFRKYDNTEQNYDNDYRSFDQDLSMLDWVLEACQRVEMGFTSYIPEPAVVNMYWIHDMTGERVNVGLLQYGERNTVWQTTTLGHRFVLEQSETGEILDDFVVTQEGFKVVGDAGTRAGKITTSKQVEEIKSTLDEEWNRAHRVKRTFSELGFQVGRVPDDLWSSIVSYYNNNELNFHREEWERKGVHVNWWEVDAYMIGMPWKLKKYWQSRLMKLVEAWTGTVLENTDIYGLRRYEHGARLLTHVDRESTHATSMIINIAQGDIKQPWAIEIYDFAGRLHEIYMDPGTIVYYESARCLHGRMAPLNGSYYVNLFTHYRPIGDPEWFLKGNPPGSIEQMMDISGMEVPSRTEQPYEEVDLTGPYDLFKYWLRTSPEYDMAESSQL